MKCRGGTKRKGGKFSSPVVGNGPAVGQALIPSRRDPEGSGQKAEEYEGEEELCSPFCEKNRVVKLLSE